jgi:CheY-like chemotaxis protein
VLAWLRTVLNEEFEVVGAVRNGRDAVEQVQYLDPDLLVIDISMPILDGLQAASRLSSNGRTKIVFLTIHETPISLQLLFRRSLGMCSEVGNGY